MLGPDRIAHFVLNINNNISLSNRTEQRAAGRRNGRAKRDTGADSRLSGWIAPLRTPLDGPQSRFVLTTPRSQAGSRERDADHPAHQPGHHPGRGADGQHARTAHQRAASGEQ